MQSLPSLGLLYIKIILLLKIIPFLIHIGIYLGIDSIRGLSNLKKALLVIIFGIVLLLISSFPLFSSVFRSQDSSRAEKSPVIQESFLMQNDLTPEDTLEKEIMHQISRYEANTATQIAPISEDNSDILYLEYQQFLVQHPPTPEILLNAARLAVHNHDYEQATYYLETAKHLYPTIY